MTLIVAGKDKSSDVASGKFFLQELSRLLDLGSGDIDEDDLQVRMSRDNQRALVCYYKLESMSRLPCSSPAQNGRVSVACWHKNIDLSNVTDKAASPVLHLLELAKPYLNRFDRAFLMFPRSASNLVGAVKETVERYYIIHSLFINGSGEMRMCSGVEADYLKDPDYVGWIYARKRAWAVCGMFMTKARQRKALLSFQSEVDACNAYIKSYNIFFYTRALGNEGLPSDPSWKRLDDVYLMEPRLAKGYLAKGAAKKALLERLERSLDWLESASAKKLPDESEPVSFGL